MVRAIVFLALAMVCGTVAAPAQAQSYQFGNVRIEGNDRIEPATILNYAGIARGETVSAAQLNDAYQRIRNSGLFEEVALTPQGGTLVISVREFPTVNVIHFEGNRRMRNEVLTELVGSQPRRMYSPAQAEADAASITEAYNATGRLAARVEPRIIRRSGNRVDLVFEIAEGGMVEVERLSFIGNRAYSDRRLRQVLETRQAGLLRRFISADTYVPERIEMDKQMLRDFYMSRGHVDFQVLDATAELSRQRDGFFVTFTVREGLPFRIGRLSTTSEVPEADAGEFHAAMRIRPGATYSPALIESTIARMEALALRQGINFLRVDPRITRNDRDQTLDIEFALVRGERIFVERIDIEGNATTLDRVIRRQFRTVEGDPFNPREIREAAERIRALGFFANADVEARPGSGPDQVIVRAEVEEQSTGSLTFGASYGGADGVGFLVSLNESNFLGRGQFVGVDLAIGADYSTSSITFREPAFLGRNVTFGFAASHAETERNQYLRYDTRRIRISPSLEFPVSERGRLELNVSVGQNKMMDFPTEPDPADPDNNPPLPIVHDAIVQEVALGGRTYAALGYNYSWDSRRAGLGGPNAYLLRFGQEFGGFGGDLKYIRTTALAIAETRVLNEEVVLRAEFEGGALAMLGSSTAASTERFFLDGKMRGFDPYGMGPRAQSSGHGDALGGNFFAVARFEAEFPIGMPVEYGIKGGAFLDVGSVWGLKNGVPATAAVDDSMKLRAVAGLSVFWETPIGPLRFNFTKALKKEDYDRERSFDITITTRF
ncbi:MAG: outer membrane protein assembly factor BamA [Gemmobacter sp.]